MIKIILVAILAYFGYSVYIRYTAQSKINRQSGKRNQKSKYSKMDIRDAEFKDIDDK